jgi:hypothetical protein
VPKPGLTVEEEWESLRGKVESDIASRPYIRQANHKNPKPETRNPKPETRNPKPESDVALHNVLQSIKPMPNP